MTMISVSIANAIAVPLDNSEAPSNDMTMVIAIPAKRMIKKIKRARIIFRKIFIEQRI
ncbi:hypothetical protein PBAL39_02775 [Pedobacter sp. BAL39]|nr:hypothetical protein PBAL39_02775 [Pedobacter sp. BAL39]